MAPLVCFFLALLAAFAVYLYIFIRNSLTYGSCWTCLCIAICGRCKVPEIPDLLQSIIYEALFLPILSSILPVFACTYHCDYKAETYVNPYPPLDAYTKISCNSAVHIVFFIVSLLAVVAYVRQAALYVLGIKQQKKLLTYSVRFDFFEMILRVCLPSMDFIC